MPAEPGIGEDDMGDDGEGQEHDDRHGHRSDAALPPPDVVFVKAADRAAAGDQQGGAAERRQPAESHDEGRHLEPGDREALQPAAENADDRGDDHRGKPAIA